MNAIFMISQNCKTSEAHKQVLNFSDKINLKMSEK